MFTSYTKFSQRDTINNVTVKIRWFTSHRETSVSEEPSLRNDEKDWAPRKKKVAPATEKET